MEENRVDVKGSDIARNAGDRLGGITENEMEKQETLENREDNSNTRQRGYSVCITGAPGRGNPRKRPRKDTVAEGLRENACRT